MNIRQFIVSSCLALGLALTTTAQATVINVGGTPNDGQDDTQAVLNAVSQASSNDTIRFAPGTYDIISLSATSALIDISNKNNLTIEGDAGGGTTIMIHNVSSSFVEAAYGSNLTVQNLTIRRTPWPFSQGVIKSVGSNFVEVERSNGFPAFTDSQFVTSSGAPQHSKVEGNFTMRVARKRIVPGTSQTYAIQNITEVSNDLYKVTFTANISNVAVNDSFILRNRTSAHVVGAFRTNGVTVKNITAAESPGILVSGTHAANVTIDKLDTKFFSGQWTSGNGDGVNLGGTRGPVIIKNSTMHGLGDDFINLHGRRMRVVSKLSNTSIEVENNQFAVAVGDEILVFRPTTGAQVGSSTVIGITNSGSNKLLTLSSPINPSINSGDLMFNESRMSNGFNIYNNEFKYGRRHGIVVRGNDGIINDNIFWHLGSKGISTQSSTDPSKPFFEGYRLTGTQITNNEFRDTSLSNANSPSMIFITTGKVGGGTANWRANSNNTISGNYFITYNGAGIRMTSAKDTVISDNTYTTLSSNFLVSPNYLVDLLRASNIEIKNNNGSADSRNHDACVNSINSSYTGTGNNWPSGC